MSAKNKTNYWLFFILGLIWMAFCTFFYLTYVQEYCAQTLFQDSSEAAKIRQHNFWVDLAYVLGALILTALLFYWAGRTFFGRSGADKGATDETEYISQLEYELNDCRQKYDDLQANSFGGKIDTSASSSTSNMDASSSSNFFEAKEVTVTESTSDIDQQIEEKKQAMREESTKSESAASSAPSTDSSMYEAKAKEAFGKKIKMNDLKLVEGIGPKIESILNNNGIQTWYDLSQSKADKISEYLIKEGGASYKVHDPTTWPEQAKLASEGKFDQLKDLQDKLKGGREV